MADRYFQRTPGTPDISGDSGVGINQSGGKMVGAPFPEPTIPVPVGKSGDFQSRDVAKLYATGGKDIEQFDSDEEDQTLQLSTDNVMKGDTSPEAPVVTGGVVSYFKKGNVTYRQTLFRTTGKIEFKEATTVELAVVAAGGSGGCTNGTGTRAGGGGGGEVLLPPPFVILPGIYDVTIGLGVSAAAGLGSGNNRQGANGGNSSFIGGTVSYIALGGGGGGGNYVSFAGLAGGSGGGAGAQAAALGTPGAATGSGGAGGPGGNNGTLFGAGGGGGAGGVGGAGSPGVGGNGGPGKLIPFTDPPIRCGGGGGGGATTMGQGIDGGNDAQVATKAINGGGGGAFVGNFATQGPSGDGLVAIVEALNPAVIYAPGSTITHFTKDGVEYTRLLVSGIGTKQINVSERPVPCRYGIIGGGGSGARANTGTAAVGGGGAGEYKEAIAVLDVANYSVTLGAGGLGVTSNNVGNPGQQTKVSKNGVEILTAAGGGGGGGAGGAGQGGDGGSGGGAGVSSTVAANGGATTSTSGGGFPGGNSNFSATTGDRTGGGGGGCAAPGGAGTAAMAGAGGAGRTLDWANDLAVGGGGGGTGTTNYAGKSGSASHGGTAGSVNAPSTTAANGGGSGAANNGNSGAGGFGLAVFVFKRSDVIITK